ncbi:imidazolonepropionase [uncultured Chitinophaga sp.]|jgi:imidazolonepropionase|uniref:imidazolonepropionase n=1 Tax=uncultured Chitinophaga sp. TaxID=339340 RepID=UPI002607C336|nr:imidazolonepropionase [uncultured Chitinophaga sp.]
MLLIGPFSQILPMSGLPLKGPLQDEQLPVITQGGIVVTDGVITDMGRFAALRLQYPQSEVHFIDKPMVLLPGFIDCHTHICYDGTRNRDYAMRVAGKSYLEIARAGGGIWDSVLKTRMADDVTLAENTVARANRHLKEGVTTIEVKSGYGLDMVSEMKMLQAIQSASLHTQATLIPTCLAAHMLPKDFPGTETEYLNRVLAELLPVVQAEQLAARVDIFIEETAFTPQAARSFLDKAIAMGFAATVHADQFSTGGSEVAVAAGALSADHLEASTDKEITQLAHSGTAAVVLPGASLGLGMPFAPARRLLDEGASLVIASDWNPGSAPMGDLLLQAAVLSAAQKLSVAETLAALTVRAAPVLQLRQTGELGLHYAADMQAYPSGDYRDLLYYQGKMKPAMVWKKGVMIS